MIRFFQIFCCSIFICSAVSAQTSAACPRSYHIKKIDPRFNLETSQVVAAAQKASHYWASNNSLLPFNLSVNKGIPISLIWDERQDKFEKSRRDKEDLLIEQETLQTKMEALRIEQATLRENKTFLEEQVQSYEKGNSAQSAQALQNTINSHNRLSKELSSQFNQMKKRFAELNDVIKLYNETYSMWRTSHIAGQYRRKGKQEAIDVFLIKDIEHLELLLAHEFGHALGFGHSEDSPSVMYPIVDKQDLKSPEVDDSYRQSLDPINCTLNSK